MAWRQSPSTSSLRMILMGRTGTGKSSSGNTILGGNVFDSSAELTSATVECRLESIEINGTQLEIMDTPGLFDTERSHEQIGVVIVQALVNMHPGPDIFLYVIKLGTRFTEEEKKAYNRFKMLFGKKVYKHLIILFTGLDEIEEKGTTVSQVLQKAPDELKEVLKDCQGRYAAFNNKRKATQGRVHPDVDKLLQTALALKKENGGEPFQSRNFCKLGESIEENVGRKLREIEDEEAKFLRYTQEKEAELQEKSEELELSRAEHDKQMADLKTEMKETYNRMLEDWQLEKEAEEEEMRAEKEAHAMTMRREREWEEQNRINRRTREEQERKQRQEMEAEQVEKLQSLIIQTTQERNLLQQEEAERQQRFQQEEWQRKQRLQQEEQDRLERLQQEEQGRQQRFQQEQFNMFMAHQQFSQNMAAVANMAQAASSEDSSKTQKKKKKKKSRKSDYSDGYDS